MTTGSAASGDLSGAKAWGYLVVGDKDGGMKCVPGVSRRRRDVMLAISEERGRESEGNGQKLCILD